MHCGSKRPCEGRETQPGRWPGEASQRGARPSWRQPDGHLLHAWPLARRCAQEGRGHSLGRAVTTQDVALAVVGRVTHLRTGRGKGIVINGGSRFDRPCPERHQDLELRIWMGGDLAQAAAHTWSETSLNWFAICFFAACRASRYPRRTRRCLSSLQHEAAAGQRSVDVSAGSAS
jgi:hypothetical protein